MLITVTARTARLSWILSGGALVQAVHRVARTMGPNTHIVPAGAPGDDEALGLQRPVEVGVAEFVATVMPGTTG
ncbi:hypothetical protein [Pseudonocardia sp. TRM90224]|uniref:hypothetical protein n=1 Tax=Pseudonocardia sp. TRM90224 TaxID=2812678 RepID=UPI001E5B701E|nr:hypothetical protein [Pseudonocardia sp. TRM90224]